MDTRSQNEQALETLEIKWTKGCLSLERSEKMIFACNFAGHVLPYG